MARRNEWEEFFDGHAPVYMENSFAKNTVEEVDFALEERERYTLGTASCRSSGGHPSNCPRKTRAMGIWLMS